MGGNPSSFPSAARPALRSTQETARSRHRHADPPRVGARQLQCCARMDRLGRSVAVRFARFPVTTARCPFASGVGRPAGGPDAIPNKKVEICIFLLYNQTSCIRGLMKIQKQPAAALRKRRNALLRQLPPLQAILRGSLIERYKRCGKPGCKCADGPGHGPKYYLSVSYPGLAAANGLCAAGARTRKLQSSSPTTTEPARSWRRSARSTANCCAAARRSKGLPCAKRFPPSKCPSMSGLGGVLLANMLGDLARQRFRGCAHRGGRG